jgi:hypothetical protein
MLDVIRYSSLVIPVYPARFGFSSGFEICFVLLKLHPKWLQFFLGQVILGGYPGGSGASMAEAGPKA